MHITTTDEKWYHKRELCLDDNTCASQLYVTDFMMRIGRTPVTMAGIGGVHTDREYRNKGYMRALYEDTVHYMQEKGYCVSALFGIENFYSKWGYASCLAQSVTKINTRDAESAEQLPDEYRIRATQKQDIEAILDLYNRVNANRSASIVRGIEGFSSFEKGSDWETEAESLILTDTAGNLQAYLVWDKNDTEVRVTEVGTEDVHLFPKLLTCLAQAAVEKRCETIQLFLPVDHPFVEYSLRFGAKQNITYTRKGDGMMRIIHQEHLFHTLVPEFESRIRQSCLQGYAGALTLETDLGMTTLTIRDGRVKVEAKRYNEIVLTIPQQILMQLLIGYRSVHDAINHNEVKVHGDALPLLAVLFPKGHPFLYAADHF